MEMHQVRYFLAVARVLNFTRAAEECHVAQPSLTRAIRQLEGELGGDLFRRERPQAQLTELGQRMLPLLKQCYDSAISARRLGAICGLVRGLARGPECRQQVLDGHALAIVGIDETRFDLAVGSDDEGGGDREQPGV
jgi:DNA-binding transcriptional LysR family regulator